MKEEIPNIKIAVDGYSSTGKSSFARRLASEIGFIYLDSGALYRCVTHFAQEYGLIDAKNGISPILKDTLHIIQPHFGPDGAMFMGEILVEKEIRSMKVASQVSPIATLSFVREYVDERLHALSEGGRVVMDGRDIGTTVFPDAEIKIFMIASDEVRAQRRYKELVAKGETPTIEDILANLKERDYIDSHRETSPLRKAEDAFVLDNSNLTMNEEIMWAKGLIQGKFGIIDL